jgi:molybdate transport system substrate-binding protein
VHNIIAALLAVALAFSSSSSSAAEPTQQPLIVFAAASLTDAITEVGTAFEKESGVVIKTSFAASSALARQIESGAPAEVFFSADQEWMDYLQQRKLLAPGSRRNVLGNKLVLVAPADSTASVKITSGSALLQAIGNGRIATGDPDSVPVGKYAKAALTTLGVWDQLAPQLVRAENVRSALAFVARGEAPFGIVYLTDAKVEKKVKLLDTFPESSHPPILYPIALTTKGSGNAKRFSQFVVSKRGAAIFEKYGFSLAH